MSQIMKSTSGRLVRGLSNVPLFMLLLQAGALQSSAVLAADSGRTTACEMLVAAAPAGMRVDTAQWQQAVTFPPPHAGEGNMPPHCLLRAVLDPRPSNVEDLSYGVGFELRMPPEWNGRFLFQGGGGMNGVLSPALGSLQGARTALGRGFAVVSRAGQDYRHRGRLSRSFPPTVPLPRSRQI